MTKIFSRGFAVLAVTLALGATGCQWNGLNSLPLPGAEATGSDAYHVKIQMPNVTTLTRNSPVRVDDVVVGSVSDIQVEDWHALVTAALDPSVELPANVLAKIGQTSLLGSNHLEFVRPDRPQGRLRDGDTVPLDRAGVYPTTEQVLSSLSVVLNGGGLAQLQDITRELNTALDGRAQDANSLLKHLNELTTSLDDQRGDIVAAVAGLDRLTDTFNRQTGTIENALDDIPPALEVLVRERPNLTAALNSLGTLSDTASRLIRESGDDLRANLAHLGPILQALADTNEHLVNSLGVLISFPFPLKNLDRTIKGDFANLMMTVDFTAARLDTNFLTGTTLGGSLGGIEGILGSAAGVAGQARDPVNGPLEVPPTVPAPAVPGLPSLPGLPAIPGITAPAAEQGGPAR